MSPLGNFLQKNKSKKGETYTHTRIGDKKLNIYAGSYNIPHSQTKQFHKLYVQHVFKKGEKEYLTEAQDRENGGPVLIDLDFRYSTEITERQHSEEHIELAIPIYSHWAGHPGKKKKNSFFEFSNNHGRGGDSTIECFFIRILSCSRL